MLLTFCLELNLISKFYLEKDFGKVKKKEKKEKGRKLTYARPSPTPARPASFPRPGFLFPAAQTPRHPPCPRKAGPVGACPRPAPFPFPFHCHPGPFSFSRRQLGSTGQRPPPSPIFLPSLHRIRPGHRNMYRIFGIFEILDGTDTLIRPDTSSASRFSIYKARRRSSRHKTPWIGSSRVRIRRCSGGPCSLRFSRNQDPAELLVMVVRLPETPPLFFSLSTLL